MDERDLVNKRTDKQGQTIADRVLQAYDYQALIFPSGMKIMCISGQHRVAALELILTQKEERWWVVKVYQTNLTHDSRALLASNAKDVQKPLDLAQSWLALNSYKSRNQVNAYKDLLESLTAKVRVNALIKHPQYAAIFNSVLEITGFWSSFTSGQITRLVKQRCIREIVDYLKHMCLQWERICGDVLPEWKALLDSLTLRHLQGTIIISCTCELKANDQTRYESNV